ncbi:MAG: thioesterase [Alphaproteobacteria bacterium]|nr:thioesterase [Alphaproteobacteria bacterium]
MTPAYGTTGFETYRGCVNAWECDQMGHMNVQFYLSRLHQAWAHIRHGLGRGAADWRKDGHELLPATHRVVFAREQHAGAPLAARSTVLAVEDGDVRVLTELFNAETGELAASLDNRARWVDLKTGRSGALPADLRDRARGLVVQRPEPRPANPPSDFALAGAEDKFFETYRGAVNAWEIDPWGLMNLQFYIARFSDAAGHFFGAIGMGGAPRRARGIGSAALDYQFDIRRPARMGDLLVLRSGLLSIGAKTFRFLHRLSEASSGELIATVDIVAVLFDLSSRKSIPVPEELRAAIAARLIAA